MRRRRINLELLHSPILAMALRRAVVEARPPLNRRPLLHPIAISMGCGPVAWKP